MRTRANEETRAHSAGAWLHARDSYMHTITYAPPALTAAAAPACCCDHRPPPRQVALDALAAGMLVTLLLDAWRITVGGIVDSPVAAAGLQWAATT